jgi:hypothetical protein
MFLSIFQRARALAGPKVKIEPLQR